MANDVISIVTRKAERVKKGTLANKKLFSLVRFEKRTEKVRTSFVIVVEISCMCFNFTRRLDVSIFERGYLVIDRHLNLTQFAKDFCVIRSQLSAPFSGDLRSVRLNDDLQRSLQIISFIWPQIQKLKNKGTLKDHSKLRNLTENSLI